MTFRTIGLMIALMTAGMLWPPEDAYDGAGLHRVLLWCGLGVLTAFWNLRFRTPDDFPAATRFRPRMADLGVVMLCVGQWISTAFVFSVPGDRRVALNLSLEWAGLLIAWFFLRFGFAAAGNRSAWLRAVVAITTGIALYGIWQHHVLYAEQAHWYQTRRNELDAQQNNPGSVSPTRVSAILREFQQSSVPLEGAARQLWEQRLLSSTEPVGTFALANTLSGVLVMALLLLIGIFVEGFSSDAAALDRARPATGSANDQAVHHSRKRVMLTLIVFGILTYCLILTKSRTAWVGLAGGIVWLFLSGRHFFRSGAIRRFVVPIVSLSLLGVCGGLFSGALDREVILEAPKSLQFRLMYWQGTMKILRNQPVIGCGPGNFRQAYLVQKALEASEEIRDPHNAILEAWTSGGLLSLLGMILVIAAVFRADGDSGNSSSSVKLSDAAAENRRLKVKRPQDSTGISLWILLGFGIHVVWQWLSGSDPLFEEPSRAIILAGALLTSWLLPIPSQLHGTNVWQAALIGLLLHLMGAGGFQMPAVMLLAFAALSGISTSGNNSDFTASLTRTPMKGSAESSPGLTPQSKDVAWISAGHRIALTFCLMTGFVVALFGLRPVWISQSLAASAQFAASQSNNRTAVDLLERSSLADPLSVSAPRQLAEYQSQRLSQMLTRIGRQVDPIASAIAVNDSSDLSAADHASSAASETEGLPDEVLKQSKAAREACELYIRADVTNVGAMRLRAELLRQLFTASRDVKILEDAISDQNKVVRMNPSSAEDWWQLTLLLSLSRESSAQDALRKSLQRTIELDDINHAWGHRDRYLTEAKREFLRKLSVD